MICIGLCPLQNNLNFQANKFSISVQRIFLTNPKIILAALQYLATIFIIILFLLTSTLRNTLNTNGYVLWISTQKNKENKKKEKKHKIEP